MHDLRNKLDNMTNKIVRGAIVGFGRWGQLLYEASRPVESLSITHVVTRSPDKAVDFCRENNLSLSGDLSAVLGDPDVDACIVATPHTQHFDQLMAIAKAGKHVYCEKPFTLTAGEAKTALSALQNASCKVAIGHNRRFAPNTIALKQMLVNGQLGEISHIEGQFHADMSGAKGRWRDSVVESPAGGMTSLGIHIVDTFVHLMGQVKSLKASSTRITDQCAFDDHTSATLQFANGARGHLTTLTATAMRWQIGVYGTKGWAELNDQDKLVFQPTAGDTEFTQFPGYEYPAVATISDALSAFAGDILGGDAFPVTADEIAHSTAILEAIIQSSMTDGEITL